MRLIPGAFLATSTLLVMTACGMPATISTPTPAAQDVTGNWQIQSIPTGPSGSTPTSGILLLGALKSQGSQVSGTLRFADLMIPNNCGTPLAPLTFTGSVDAAKNLTLTSSSIPGSSITVQLPLAVAVSGFSTGTLAITGNACNFASAPAIGAQIPSVTGTFSGTVSQVGQLGTLPAPPPTATASFVLNQSASPDADGQFPVTGSISITTPTCTGTTSMTGLVSGSVVSLHTRLTGPILPAEAQVSGGITPAAPNSLYAGMTFPTGPCATPSASITYRGTLTRN